ncbi:Alpha-(1,3)-fucosyltransferase 7 [Holothuria leucospilota]|uniref:Fucosyltransferase n=1 Tax=Holothuria leucospilota TaxID=206669 RepID=A0A9Q0YCF3_HOLLE|nr:Alpha-(1,3)-fucosyltransferase 7 [Holothuria leucospilota]
MKVRRLKISQVAKVSIFINAIAFLYLFFGTETISTRRPKAISSWQLPAPGSIFLNWRPKPPWKHQLSLRSSCMKTILLFGIKEHWFTFCKFPEMARFRHLIEFPRVVDCEAESNCSVLLKYSKEPKDIAKADIVVFTNVYHWLNEEDWLWAHGNRTKGQPWIIASQDSPLYVPGFLPPEQYRDTTYTWMATYKMDSEIRLPYGFYQPYSEAITPEIDLRTFLTNKSKLVAWMSSNCNTLQWDRYKFVEDLHSVVTVEKYGDCGDKSVPWNNEKAIREVLQKYKFYLSLENSCCDDYISEKFWRALAIGLVPIVVGASYEQYLKVAPPNSFIHVDQFDSLAQLAIHITIISNDDEKYLEYFKWRNLGTVVYWSQEEQYVTPLMNRTHCSIVQHYLNAKLTEADRNLEYNGKRWGGSCKECGSKWIRRFQHPNT